jgi:hypothetical protein
MDAINVTFRMTLTIFTKRSYLTQKRPFLRSTKRANVDVGVKAVEIQLPKAGLVQAYCLIYVLEY